MESRRERGERRERGREGELRFDDCSPRPRVVSCYLDVLVR